MNDDKVVFGECTVFLKPDGVELISKDDGVSFDMANEAFADFFLGSHYIIFVNCANEPKFSDTCLNVIYRLSSF